VKASEYRETAKEADEQAVLFEWAEAMIGIYPCLEWMYHIANGEKRDKATAAKLKRMGVKSGVPDVVLPHVTGGFCGMYIEMKRLNGGQHSTEQLRWIEHLAREGYYVVSCRGFEDAEKQIENYIKGKIRRGAS
jgi:hypothetical protein